VRNLKLKHLSTPNWSTAAHSFLSAFAKFREAAVNFVICLSVRPSAWNSWSPTGRIFMTFGVYF